MMRRGPGNLFFLTRNCHFTVEKGSICVNGVSLTVCESKDDRFSVAIIPYTFENTNFKNLNIGDEVNIEFDIIGKYISKMMKSHITDYERRKQKKYDTAYLRMKLEWSKLSHCIRKKVGADYSKK